MYLFCSFSFTQSVWEQWLDHKTGIEFCKIWAKQEVIRPSVYDISITLVIMFALLVNKSGLKIN